MSENGNMLPISLTLDREIPGVLQVGFIKPISRTLGASVLETCG